MLLVSAFSMLVFALAIVGTYGVASYSVTERSGELGVRVALGATAGDIRRLVLGSGLWLTASGILIGGVAAAALSHLLSRFVYGVSALDVVTFTGAPILLGAATLLATFLPARRAARVDPMRVLR
jgi:ABC-type antimicrobial peptide transport system permease subunit